MKIIPTAQESHTQTLVCIKNTKDYQRIAQEIAQARAAGHMHICNENQELPKGLVQHLTNLGYDVGTARQFYHISWDINAKKTEE